jgi:hypothetical protein
MGVRTDRTGLTLVLSRRRRVSLLRGRKVHSKGTAVQHGAIHLVDDASGRFGAAHSDKAKAARPISLLDVNSCSLHAAVFALCLLQSCVCF